MCSNEDPMQPKIKKLKENIGENQLLSSDRQGLPKHETLLRNHVFNDIFHSIKIIIVINIHALNNTSTTYMKQKLQKMQEK